MRTAIVADIHANLEALEAVVRSGRAQGVDAWVCLGDVVGYGADPGACLERIRELTAQVVLGNHDAAAAGRLDPLGFNDWARAAIEWTAARLSRSQRHYLADRPLSLLHRQAWCGHADPVRPDQWGYVDSPGEAAAALAALASDLGFVGHSHRPWAAVAEGGGARFLSLAGGPRPLPASRRCLANAGSVGQPRDGDPRAGFLVWDEDEATLELVRCEYDVAAAQRKILEAGLPRLLAARLAVGQ